MRPRIHQAAVRQSGQASLKASPLLLTLFLLVIPCLISINCASLGYVIDHSEPVGFRDYFESEFLSSPAANVIGPGHSTGDLSSRPGLSDEYYERVLLAAALAAKQDDQEQQQQLDAIASPSINDVISSSRSLSLPQELDYNSNDDQSILVPRSTPLISDNFLTNSFAADVDQSNDINKDNGPLVEDEAADLLAANSNLIRPKPVVSTLIEEETKAVKADQVVNPKPVGSLGKVIERESDRTSKKTPTWDDFLARIYETVFGSTTSSSDNQQQKHNAIDDNQQQATTITSDNNNKHTKPSAVSSETTKTSHHKTDKKATSSISSKTTTTTGESSEAGAAVASGAPVPSADSKTLAQTKQEAPSNNNKKVDSEQSRTQSQRLVVVDDVDEQRIDKKTTWTTGGVALDDVIAAGYPTMSLNQQQLLQLQQQQQQLHQHDLAATGGMDAYKAFSRRYHPGQQPVFGFAPAQLISAPTGSIATFGASRGNDLYFLVMVGAFCVMAVAMVLAAGLFAYRVQQNRKQCAEMDCPTYGVVGPKSVAGGYFAHNAQAFGAGFMKPPGANEKHQNHHGANTPGTDGGFQSSNDSGIGGTGNGTGTGNGVSSGGGGGAMPPSFMASQQNAARIYHYQHQKQQMISSSEGNYSDDENEDGNYTVYECPGLASAHDMEVKNPLFNDD